MSRRDPDITVTKVYFPEEDPIPGSFEQSLSLPFGLSSGVLLSDQLSATAPEPAVDSDVDDDRSEADDSNGADSSGMEETSDEESEPENTPDRSRVKNRDWTFSSAGESVTSSTLHVSRLRASYV